MEVYNIKCLFSSSLGERFTYVDRVVEIIVVVSEVATGVPVLHPLLVILVVVRLLKYKRSQHIIYDAAKNTFTGKTKLQRFLYNSSDHLEVFLKGALLYLA